jgi:hypothetical protein
MTKPELPGFLLPNRPTRCGVPSKQVHAAHLIHLRGDESHPGEVEGTANTHRAPPMRAETS